MALSNTMVERSPDVMSLSGTEPSETIQSRSGRAKRLCLAMCLIGAVLSGCSSPDSEAETEEDRRFANDPTRPSQPTETVTPASTVEPASPVADLEPADKLFKARGAPSTVYATLKGEIVVLRVEAARASPLRIPPPQGQVFARLTSSPSGDRVAALLVPAAEDAGAGPVAGTLAVYDASGAQVEIWNDVIDLGRARATPVSGGNGTLEESPVQIEWASQGDQILISSGGGDLVTVPLDGAPTPIEIPAGIRVIEDAQWSPRGNQIAILAKGGDGPAGVQLFTPNADPPDLRQVIPPNEGTIGFPTIERFAWLPDGSGIAYIMADERTGSPVDGQLFVFDLASGRHRLIATPGQGGPSASIVDFVLSPDGKAVAYQIQTSDQGQWTLHSLWMRSLTDARAVRLPVADVIEVNAMWWTSQGLLWGQALQTEGSGATETFVLQAPSSEPVELASIEVVAAIDASPVASPQATPVATPVG